MTHSVPVDKVVDSAVYIFPPSNLKRSHDIGSGGSCLAAFPLCVREKVLPLETIGCGAGV